MEFQFMDLHLIPSFFVFMRNKMSRYTYKRPIIDALKNMAIHVNRHFTNINERSNQFYPSIFMSIVSLRFLPNSVVYRPPT
jgi:acyl carrier protein phosphodiesterase